MMSSGEIDIRKTHPNLYWLLMILAVVSLALGLNFIVNKPTFQIFGAPNNLWGAVFLVLFVGEVVFLNLHRRLRLVRACMIVSVGYMIILGIGTMKPFIDGTGSLQLPVLYIGLSAMQIPLLFEPFINPRTSR